MALREIIEILTKYSTLKIFLGVVLLGFAAGILGNFVILKQKALLGDFISHTVLPGIALAYLFFRKTDIWVIWIGSFGASIISLFLMEIIKRYSKIKLDTVLSLVLSSFFGLGNVLLAYAQKGNEDSSIAVLEKFVLGQAALMEQKDVIFIALGSLIVLIVVFLLWKELKLFVFDEIFAQSIGFNNVLITCIFNALLIGVIVISLKITGIILTSAFFIMPSIISRQISDKLSVNVILSSVIMVFSGFVGIVVSTLNDNVPTGPTIIIVTGIVLFLVLLLAPKYGFISRKIFNSKKEKVFKFN
ncbi:metal ABC transporter permease [Candidatus Phytoplasma australiense]|uniref:Manganese transport system membrane protein mntC n=1 Tax=Strawberry lethal yellows phytoplasma (CPA) str. NZSb11 TaxID=980422 RepID=R4RNY6_PHYAS|nr:metal ABC transporter permease [Candidatus Phytoplasma australiense]AGL90191.1 Manganese transport system membrane protein mntC [Strawberry lethal yellows phytoplasma (CPA) str. NZSb11]